MYNGEQKTINSPYSSSSSYLAKRCAVFVTPTSKYLSGFYFFRSIIFSVSQYNARGSKNGSYLVPGKHVT